MNKQVEMFPDVVEQMLNDALEHIHREDETWDSYLPEIEEVMSLGQEEVQQEEEGHEEDNHEDQRSWEHGDE